MEVWLCFYDAKERKASFNELVVIACLFQLFSSSQGSSNLERNSSSGSVIVQSQNNVLRILNYLWCGR